MIPMHAVRPPLPPTFVLPSLAGGLLSREGPEVDSAVRALKQQGAVVVAHRAGGARRLGIRVCWTSERLQLT